MKYSLVGGEELKDTQLVDVISPATEEVVEKVTTVEREHIGQAIDLAFEEFKKFSALPLKDRAKILEKAAVLIEERKENLAKILSLESGKPIRDARIEVVRTIGVFRASAREAHFVLEGKIHRVDAYDYPAGNENRLVMETREPIGVVAAILPFNFPSNSFAHKVAPNLAAGNTVIVKPSISTPLTAIELANILYEAGLPKNALSVLVGKSSMIGEELINNPKIEGITFTGSTEIGLKIASKAVMHAKRIAMELGGSDPFIILDDANITQAIPIAVKARFEYAGQNCNSAKRFIVHTSKYKEFVEKFVEATRRLRLGDPLKEDIDIGPLIDGNALKDMEDFVQDAVSRGGKILLGGKKVEGKGFFFEPTVIGDITSDFKVMREEVFGPIAPIITFETLDEAVEIANLTEFGLQAAVFTNDLKKGIKVAREIKTGSVIINESTRLRWDTLPFGGVKKSGVGGREGVRTTILNFTEPKIISMRLD